MQFPGDFRDSLTVKIIAHQDLPILFREQSHDFPDDLRQFRLFCLCGNIRICGNDHIVNGLGIQLAFPQPVAALGTGDAGKVAR